MADPIDPRGEYNQGDVAFGVPPRLQDFEIDVDGDGETTARVHGGTWMSDDQDLADYLNARASEINLTDDQSLASDACELMGCEMRPV